MEAEDVNTQPREIELLTKTSSPFRQDLDIAIAVQWAEAARFNVPVGYKLIIGVKFDAKASNTILLTLNGADAFSVNNRDTPAGARGEIPNGGPGRRIYLLHGVAKLEDRDGHFVDMGHINTVSVDSRGIQTTTVRFNDGGGSHGGNNRDFNDSIVTVSIEKI